MPPGVTNLDARPQQHRERSCRDLGERRFAGVVFERMTDNIAVN